MKKIVVALFAITVVATTNAQEHPEVTISGSQVRKITSSIVEGQEYDLQISLPAGYEDSTKEYPVVYLMDSQWDFPLVSSIYGEQYFDGFIPELIIVGVTWGGENPNPDVLRTRDYTPTDTGRQIATGGADKFLDFMKSELFPFIEKNYKADGDNRTLMGCSLGGLFTLYTLYTHTDMFNGYAAASPAIGWDSGVLASHEEAFSKKELTRPVRVYMTVGDVERGAPNYEKHANTMLARNHDGVSVRSKVLENTGHSGTKSETYTRGLQYVFERNQLALGDAALNKHVGAYQFENGNKVEIKNEGNALGIHFSPQYNFELKANTDKHFYATHQLFNIHFTEKGFDMVTYGNTRSLTRVE